MNKKYTLIIAFSLVFAQLGIAQWTTIEDFNQLNFDIDNEDFAKQHRPLNGAKVKMLPFSVDDQFGFVANSPQREELIPPSFTKVHAVYQEGAVVQQEERFGLISPENQWLLPPSFENILKEQQVFHGVQLAVDTISNELFIQNVYVNEAGKLLFAEAAHDQKSFNPVDTIAWFRYGREYHIRGISGHLWKKFDYDENRKFLGIADNRLLFAELESIETGNWRYQGYDVHGKLIFQITSYNRLNNLVQLSPDLFIHTESGFHFEFCDASGKDLPFIYNDNYLKSLDYYRYYRGLYQSHYPVRNERGSEMGLIARDGRMILNLEHDFVDEVKNEMVFCIKRGQMDGQFLSLDGKVVMDRVGTEFDLLMRHEFFRRPIAFDEGLMVGVGRIHPPEGEYINANEDPIFGSKWLHRYYYDQDKNIPIKLDANIILAGPFREGLAPVVDRNRNLGFINQKGKMVIEPAYDFVIQGGMVSFVVLPEFIGGFAYIASHNIYIDKAGKALTRHTEKFDFSGKWMEVRTEDTKILIGQQYPSLEFHFEKTGIVRAKEYDDPYAKLLTGRFVLQDSLLLLNPNDDTYPFRS
ncbi:MAG: WG repeat-containing protein, partial [Bacteroidota bacterium]